MNPEGLRPSQREGRELSNGEAILRLGRDIIYYSPRLYLQALKKEPRLTITFTCLPIFGGLMLSGNHEAAWIHG